MKRVSEIEGTGPINMFLLSGSPIFCFPKDPQVYEIKMQDRDRLEIQDGSQQSRGGNESKGLNNTIMED